MPARSIARFCLAVAFSFFAVQGEAQDFLLQSDGAQKWFRGNMHTHSLWSDGDNFPELIAMWYRDHGYQFLVYTDHNTLLQNERWVELSRAKGGPESLDALRKSFSEDWVVTRKKDDKDEIRLKTFDEIFARLAVPQEFLLIQGEEITDRFGKKPIHMCATNTSELLPPTGGDSVVDVMQRNIDAATSRRERSGVKTIIHLNHPNFGYAITAEQLMRVVGENFFEVYNGHPTVHNSGDESHASTDRMWDIINTFRLARLNLPMMYGLATDDGHNYFETEAGKGAQPGRGWVMVLAESLDPDSLVDSLEAGRFYSSSGVSLDAIQFEKNQLKITVKPEDGVTYRIDFIGTRRTFNENSLPADDDPAKAEDMTRIYSTDIGTVFKSVEGTSAGYTLDGTELYVRALITSSKQHPNPSEQGEFERAWIQPIVPPTGVKPTN